MDTSSNMNQNSSNPTALKSQLKQIGDQIEQIAKQLRGQGNQQDIDELYELGDKVEHFCDNMDFAPIAHQSAKSASSASQSKVSAQDTSGSTNAQARGPSNANQTGQKNQDEEAIDSQKPNPVM